MNRYSHTPLRRSALVRAPQSARIAEINPASRPRDANSISSFARTAIALAVLGVTGSASAATAKDALMAELRRLAERVEKLEQRNAELEAKLVGPTADAELADRVGVLEEQNRALEAGLANKQLSEREPGLVTRLKAVETLAQSAKDRTDVLDAFEGIEVGASLVAVAQRVNAGARTNDNAERQLNWRGDLEVTLPGGDIGRGSGQFFAHVRLGQGESFTRLRPTFTGALNSTAFQLSDPDDGRNAANATALLAQAWYQLDLPIGAREGQRLEFTVGKIDPFVFFDQNAVADDESERFLNNVFVHNPMLDSGGAVGADDYGFSPGARIAFHSELNAAEWWRASVGVFGAGAAASFGNRLKAPFVIGQLEYGTKRFGGLDGTYRVYAWRNGQHEGYDASTGTTTGWGASIDQRVTDGLSLFARYGQSTSGTVAFDRAVTVGGELAGNAWGRSADGLGFAYGWLRSSRGFRRDTAADPTLAGFAADGAEQVAELYYRWHVNEHLALTPDLQHVRRAGADRDAKHITAVGLRALYAF